MEIIQITEEQANDMLVEIMDGQGDDSFLSFSDAIKSMKATGYIKSALEEARGKYYSGEPSSQSNYGRAVTYIKALEKALEVK